jgi:2-C-methyl-D-erythritol 2,4-cyclodiphosphate synthase
MSARIGYGYDIHALAPGRPFLLGGVEIPSDNGPVGHSDADVLSHAIIDALLGALGKDDIGTHFPDTDKQWVGASGKELIGHTLAMLEGWTVVNIDATIITELPKIGPHRSRIRENLARQMALPADRISIKAKTNEGFDAIGTKAAVACHVVVLLEEKPILEDDTWL